MPRIAQPASATSPRAGRRGAPRVAAGVFFCGYLLFQIVYPMLPWFLPGFSLFTWHMYAAWEEDVRFAVIFADGSRRDVGSPQKVGSPVRVLGASLDQPRFLPPWLCATWKGAERIVLINPVDGSEVTRPCQEFGR